MKKKIYWVYIASIFVLFLAVGFIAKQWWVGADSVAVFDMDFPSSCQTATGGDVQLECVIDDDIAEFCSGDVCRSGTNIIHVKQSLCTAAGITSRVYTTSEFEQLLNSMASSYGAAKALCNITYAYTLLCDDSNNRNDNTVCKAVSSENFQELCIKRAVDANCSGSNPNWEITQCMDMCQGYALNQTARRVWDTCMCNEESAKNGIDAANCCNCLDECKNVEKIKAEMPATCLNNGYVDLADLNSVCDTTSTGSHGCDWHNTYSERQVSDGSTTSADCQGTGTHFDPGHCNKSYVTPYLPKADAFPEDLLNNECVDYQATYYEAVSPKILLIKAATCVARGNCSTDEQMYCPSGTCSDGRGGVKFMCMMSTCDYHSTEYLTTSVTSSSATSRGIEKASAASALSEVTVKVQKDRGPYSATDNAIKVLGTTGQDGKIKASLTLGSWKVTAEKSGYKTASQVVNVQKDQPFELNLNLVKEGTTPPADTTGRNLTVRVKSNALNSPAVSGATVKISKGDKNYSVTTSDSGEASFTNLTEFNWNVEITKPGMAVISPIPTVAQLGGTTNYLNVVMGPAGGKLTVAAIDQIGTNTSTLAGVAVVLKSGNASHPATTDANGQAVFNNVAPGTWTLTGTKTGYHQEQPVSITLTNADAQSQLVMDSDLKKLTVQVKMQSGTNVAKATVRIVGPSGTFSKLTGTDGTAVFDNLKVGAWSISFAKSGYALQIGQEKMVGLLEDVSKTFIVQKAGTARFYIKGRTLGVSTPLPGATIKLCDKPLNDTTKTCWTKQTNYLGMRTFQDMAPGTYYYQATAANYTTSTGTLKAAAGNVLTKSVQLEKR